MKAACSMMRPPTAEFLMIKEATNGEDARTQINVILNWTEELRARVPTGQWFPAATRRMRTTSRGEDRAV